ncbi:hypothetical protein LEMLEM_LOCUS4889 [Lemmus lemmus]
MESIESLSICTTILFYLRPIGRRKRKQPPHEDAVSVAEALVLVAGECPEHWTLVACGLRTQHTISRWCDTATSKWTDSGQCAMLPFGLVHDTMFSIFCAHIELLSFLVFTLEKLFRYLIILTSIFNHDTCYCNKLDFKH